MSDSKDPRGTLIDELRRDMPPHAEEYALDRVRTRALASRNEFRSAHRPRRAWRIASVVAATAAVLVVGALALAPRHDTTAFAREQAADALLLKTDGRVLHSVVRYRSTGWNEQFGHDPRYDMDQRWSSWVDPLGKRIRDESVNVGDGSLDGLTVRVGDRILMFQNNVRFGTGKTQQLVEWSKTTDPFGTMMGFMIDQLREVIADGSAKVTGSTTIDGEEYWVVEYSQEKGDLLTVTMRKSDYRLKTWVRKTEGSNGNGKWTGTDRYEFETIEQLDPKSLPEGFFSFDKVIAAAKPGTTIDRR
jgi:hypothetical protein